MAEDNTNNLGIQSGKKGMRALKRQKITTTVQLQHISTHELAHVQMLSKGIVSTVRNHAGSSPIFLVI